MEITEYNVLNQIIKNGHNKERAKSHVKNHYQGVMRIYKGQELTVKKVADLVTSFACL